MACAEDSDAAGPDAPLGGLAQAAGTGAGEGAGWDPGALARPWAGGRSGAGPLGLSAGWARYEP